MADVVVPNIGDVEEVEVIELCVGVGDTVALDDSVVVIESDKASMEVPSTVAGVVTEMAVALGDIVQEGSLLIRVDAADTASAEATPQANTAAEQESAAAPEPPAAPTPEVQEPVPAAGSSAEVEVLVPDIGDAEDVVVIEVAVAVGDAVGKDDLLVVVESDKASMEIPAPQAGVITEVLVKVDDPVQTGLPIAKMQIEAGEGTSPAAPKSAPTPEASAKPTPPSQPSPETVETPASAEPEVRSAGAQVYAGPAVRRLARELGVDLTEVSGTGARGRIVKDDVKGFVKQKLKRGDGAPAATGAGIPAIPEVDFAKFGPVEVEPMSRMRRTGAANLHRSWLNVPHVTQHDDVDITELEDFRASLKPEAKARGISVHAAVLCDQGLLCGTCAAPAYELVAISGWRRFRSEALLPHRLCRRHGAGSGSACHQGCRPERYLGAVGGNS